MNKSNILFRSIFSYILIFLLVLYSPSGVAQIDSSEQIQFIQEISDSIPKPKHNKELFSHQFSLETRLGRMLHTEPFYRMARKPELSIGRVRSVHVKYGFGFPEESLGGQIFPNTHQGIGLALFDFGNPQEIGKPFTAYLFQQSTIVHLFPSVALDYEWNFGISSGWKPYNPVSNPNNIIVGSTLNAYLNLGFVLKWQATRQLALQGGVDFTHFSNGNTEYPNAGVNVQGIKFGVLYDMSNTQGKNNELRLSRTRREYKFDSFVSYDLIVFGSWRRKGVDFFGQQIPSPAKYPVFGASFAPMYNLGYRFRTGVSLDAIYDGSANVYTEDYIVGTQQVFYKPNWQQQIAMGLSARADYIMPIFTVGVGLGTHVLRQGQDFKGTYQTFALKVRATRNSFIHIGYNLKDFHEPNYLMLGLGYRFNNRMPSLLSK